VYNSPMKKTSAETFYFYKGADKSVKLKLIVALVAVATMTGFRVGAQIYDTNNVVVQTFAGSGFSGYVDGQETQTMFNNPSQVVADSAGNLFVVDSFNYRIRKISPDATVSTFAGGGASATGYGTNASLVYSLGPMAIDHSNALWIIAPVQYGGILLRIGSDAYVSRPNESGLSGLSASGGVCVDSGNNVYISDFNGEKIYRYRTNGVLEVFAGSGNTGSADGNGIFTSFSGPSALATDSADNIYVWDRYNHLIRRINQNRDVVAISGSQMPDEDGVGRDADFNSIYSMCADSFGNIYLACGTSVRRMNAQTNVVTLAGSFSQSGYANGTGNLARFNGANGICISGGTIYVADWSNQRIRTITNNPTAQPVLPANVQLNTYPGLQVVGTVGRTYQVQSSPDMTNWTTRATLLLTSSPYLWFDQNPVAGSKFYRALLLP
jgi:hypothetical protein